MMIPVFENNKDWLRMRKIIDSWLGTPYKHLTMVKGGGADCTLFIGACWKEFGIINKVNYDYYPRDWHTHTKEERVLKSFFEHWNEYRNAEFEFQVVSNEDRKLRGDLLAFSTTSQKVTNHASIYMGEDSNKVVKMCHSINGRGVSYFPYGKYWEKKLTKIIRTVRVN